MTFEMINGKFMCNVKQICYEYIPQGWEAGKKNLITAVFLNYNSGAFVEKSVRSVLAQDCRPCEMLFMDDASKDGSGSRMEAIVRGYKGLHKVVVVRNNVNCGICGQWNRAVSLATGTWLGMFCGDDIAKADRIRKVEDYIVAHPSLKGLCTSGEEFDSRTGQRLGGMSSTWPEKLVCGKIDLGRKEEYDSPVIGATAFWHRDVFRYPIPYARCDDVELRWILQLLFRDESGPVWAWIPSINAIDYMVGGGITNSFRPNETSGSVGRCRFEMERQRRQAVILTSSWNAVVAYYREHSAPICYRRFAKERLIEYKWVAAGTLRRLVMIHNIIWLLSAAPRKALGLLVLSIRQFFGIWVAALLTVGIKKVLRTGAEQL